jgi:hypothetical protein
LVGDIGDIGDMYFDSIGTEIKKIIGNSKQKILKITWENLLSYHQHHQHHLGSFLPWFIPVRRQEQMPYSTEP